MKSTSFDEFPYFFPIRSIPSQYELYLVCSLTYFFRNLHHQRIVFNRIDSSHGSDKKFTFFPFIFRTIWNIRAIMYHDNFVFLKVKSIRKYILHILGNNDYFIKRF